jgi:hypothetical protein
MRRRGFHQIGQRRNADFGGWANIAGAECVGSPGQAAAGLSLFLGIATLWSNGVFPICIPRFWFSLSNNYAAFQLGYLIR